MFNKIIGIGLLVVVVGALAFGAVKVTMAAFDGEETAAEIS